MRLCLGAEGAAELRREPCARMPGGFYRGIRAEVCREGSRADRKKRRPAGDRQALGIARALKR